MNEKYTHVTVVLDKSASMSCVVSDTIGGFNKFLTDQKEDKEKATISLFQFSNTIDSVYTMKERQ
jgi:hypothetical protein